MTDEEAIRAAATTLAFSVTEYALAERPNSLVKVVDGLLAGRLRDSIHPEVVDGATRCASALTQVAERAGKSLAEVLAAAGVPDELATARVSAMTCEEHPRPWCDVRGVTPVDGSPDPEVLGLLAQDLDYLAWRVTPFEREETPAWDDAPSPNGSDFDPDDWDLDWSPSHRIRN